MLLINRMAVEVAADEAALRQRISGLLESGKTEDAKTLLHAWDSMAAGDVLEKHAGNKNGR